jgi:CheY-like chemotaxis protein
VQLPVKSGWQVMEELKANAHTRPIPVHMMSSHEVRNRSLSKGAVDFINKPVAFEKLGEVFQRIEQALKNHPKKVLIVEENPKHAQALAYFLESYKVKAEIRNSITDGIYALNNQEADCVILDMEILAQRSYDLLEEVKASPGLENLPIIIFTGKNLSHIEEMKIRQYADSIVVKTANSYQRILDEVSLFLHLVEENKSNGKPARYKKLGELSEVLRGKTVLVADDDVRNIFSLTKSLENYGMTVVSAMDGKEALKVLHENGNVDLVLMDMMMPEMDGYESTRKIRQIRKYSKIPIIAVTAKAMTGDREKCIAAGASDYITKPVDIDQLVSLLRVWLYA